MDKIKVSVVIPFYNGREYLEECVQSVCAQTLQEIEIILVDDGSTDGCSELADALAEKDSRIVVIHQQNKGLSGARNSGIEKAVGDYIGFVDGDDYLAPAMYETLYTIAEEKDCEIAIGGYRSFWDGHFNSPEIWDYYNRQPMEPDEIRRRMPTLVCNSLTFVWRRLYRRTLFFEKGIRFDESLRVCEDASFSMECFLKASRMVAVPDILYFYRNTPGSLIRSRKYNPVMTDCLSRQYDIKISLAKTLAPEQFSAIQNALASYSYNHTAQVILFNIFRCPKPFREFLRFTRSNLFRDMLRHFDIQTKKSRSTDWIMIRLVQLHLSVPAYWFGKKAYERKSEK